MSQCNDCHNVVLNELHTETSMLNDDRVVRNKKIGVALQAEQAQILALDKQVM